MKDKENHEIKLEVNDIGYSKKPICLYNRENKLLNMSLNSWNPFLITGETDSCYQIRLLCGDIYNIQKTLNVRNANEVQEKKKWKPFFIGMKALSKLIYFAESICTIIFLFCAIIISLYKMELLPLAQNSIITLLFFTVSIGIYSFFFRLISPYISRLHSYLERRAYFYPAIAQYEKLEIDKEGQRCPANKRTKMNKED